MSSCASFEAPETHVLAARACLANTSTPWGSSRWSAFRRCRREHHLKYHLKIVRAPRAPDEEDLDLEAPAPSSKENPLDTGNLIHAILAFVQQGVLLGEPKPRDWEIVLEAAEEESASGVRRWDPLSIEEAFRVMSAYWAHWGIENAGWPEGSKIVAIEEYVGEPAGGELGPLACETRADSIIALPSGEIVVPDHKSRKAAIPKDRDSYARGLTTRGQFAALSWLTRKKLQLDYFPSVMVNALIKTKLVKFDRLMVRFDNGAAEQWAAWQRLYAAMLAECAEDSTPNLEHCAPEMGRRCDYFDWCHGTEAEKARKFKTAEAVESEESEDAAE